MKSLLRILIQEFHQWEIPKPVEREIHFAKFPPNIRKVQVLMGVRRGGKTWIFYQKINELIKGGLDKRKILYINFEDDRLAGFSSQDFQSLLDAYFELYPEFKNSSDLAFFFDEIHLILGWEKFLRRLIDQEKMELYVTGSSASMLSSEIATTLRGRGWPQEVFPCNFPEYVAFKNPQILKPRQASLLQNLAKDYLVWGGFPESLFVSKDLHSALLQDYMNTVVFRDIVDRHKLSNARQVKLFLLYILRGLAAPLSLNKLYNKMKSQGHSIGKNSLYEYLSYFEDAYALFAIPIYNFSEQVRQVNPKKIYAVDPGIITAYSIKPDFENASRLENGVFCVLRRKYKEIFYYHTKKKQEVDFLTLSETGDLALFQVCYDMTHPDTQESEIQALTDALQELEQKVGIIITDDQEETIEREGITIHVIPFWKWATGGSDLC